jgi:hypothetical protein
MKTQNWRITIEETKDEWRKSDILQAVANISTSKEELKDVLKCAKSIKNKIGSKYRNIEYDVFYKVKTLKEVAQEKSL